MALLRAREQIDYLDRYAAALAQRAEVARLVRELRVTGETQRKLVAEERESARLQERLRHELADIEGASLRVDEEAELKMRRDRLQHVERLRQSALAAYQALMGAEEDGREQPGAVDLLGRALSACQDGGKIDPELSKEADVLNAALIQAEDSAHTLREYLDTLEADPQTLEQTAERLFLIGDLKRKYGDSIPEILAYATDARRSLGEIEHRAERMDQLQLRQQELIQQLSAAVTMLSARRRAAAEKLSSSVGVELADLRLAGARFVVSVVQLEDPEGIPLDGRTVAVDLAGADRVEFLIAASTAEEPRPIARVASGGELARIALALKTVLSRVETRPTLIFDEIDVGVGGRTAPVVGQKLWAVADAGHQVLCVTHLAQVAAFADYHFGVSRKAAETSVAMLGDDQRVEELAAMLAGSVTNAARQSARELLARASEIKHGKVSS
jgi:DNA repair protein RecN (Recombination protein N)